MSNTISLNTLKGPAIFLAQFSGDAAPFDLLPATVIDKKTSRKLPGLS